MLGWVDCQFSRYLPAQLVATEVQVFQVGEVGQFSRYLPAQLVETEVQAPNDAFSHDAPIHYVAGGDTGPIADWGVREPARIVTPVRAISGVVERGQRSCIPAQGLGSRRKGCLCRNRPGIGVCTTGLR